MKLKLSVVAMSIGLMGLSCSSIAADTTTTTTTTTTDTQVTQVKHKHHHKKHHKVSHERREVRHHEESYKGENEGYKGEGFQPVMVTCPKVDVFTSTLDAMSQNVGTAKATVDCNKPIQLAGGINFDTQWGNLHEGFMGENNSRFSLNNAYLNVTGDVNEWVKAFLQLSYNSVNDDVLSGASLLANPLSHVAIPKPGLYSSAYNLNTLSLEQGVITIGNVEQFPLFLRLGKQFMDYGRYQTHPITRSLTQVMTETLQTGAELSFVSGWNAMDIHGSLFVFNNPVARNGGPHSQANFGGQLGFGQLSSQLGWDVGVGYLYDITGANDIGYAVSYFNGTSFDGEGTYSNRIDALTAYGMVNSGPFSVSAHYATALENFNAVDLARSVGSTTGAQPWTADITAAFGFNYWLERSQNIYLGYQASGEAVNLYLPKYRWLAGYGIDAWKNTNVGLEYSYDKDYSVGNGGSGEGSNRIALRVGVKFG